MNIIEEEKQRDISFSKNFKKLILIENLDELGLSDKQKKKFIRFFYDNLDDMHLLEALEEFKKHDKTI